MNSLLKATLVSRTRNHGVLSSSCRNYANFVPTTGNTTTTTTRSMSTTTYLTMTTHMNVTPSPTTQKTNMSSPFSFQQQQLLPTTIIPPVWASLFLRGWYGCGSGSYDAAATINTTTTTAIGNAVNSTAVATATTTATTTRTTSLLSVSLLQNMVDTILQYPFIVFISTLKRRRKMMNKHKLRKRRKKNRMKNKK